MPSKQPQTKFYTGAKHNKAIRRAASQRGMDLGEYLRWLTMQDCKELGIPCHDDIQVRGTYKRRKNV